MKRKMGEGGGGEGEGETSRFTLQLCLRAITRRKAPHMVWFLHNISIGNGAMPTLQPCHKDKVRRLTKEAKKRVRDLNMKMNAYRRRKFTGERFEEEEEAATLTPMRYTPDIPRESCWASLDSKVFCFGSRKRCGAFSNEVRIFNLFDDLEKGCEFGPPMMSPRRLGNAVTVDDKVYVFGGTKEGSSGPWAEAFEKYDNVWRWRALPEPPFSLNLSNIFSLPYTDNGVKKILFGSGAKGLYAYCPTKDSSVVVDEEFKFRGLSFTPLLVVDKTIYWVGDEIVRAYDFGQKISFSGRTHFWAVKNALHISTVHRHPYQLPFFHLRGDMFCLLWDSFDGGRDCPRSTFVLHKFRILKRMDKNGGECSLSVKPFDMEYIVTDQEFKSFDAMLLSMETHMD